MKSYSEMNQSDAGITLTGNHPPSTPGILQALLCPRVGLFI